MKLEIITPEQIVFTGTVSSVTLPGSHGLFTIWDNHAPLISSLKKGRISYVSNNETSELKVEGGFAEINQNVVTVCVESLEGTV